MESPGVRFRHRAPYSGEPLFVVDVFADKFEQLFAEMLDDGFADFLGRVF